LVKKIISVWMSTIFNWYVSKWPLHVSKVEMSLKWPSFQPFRYIQSNKMNKRSFRKIISRDVCFQIWQTCCNVCMTKKCVIWMYPHWPKPNDTHARANTHAYCHWKVELPSMFLRTRCNWREQDITVCFIYWNVYSYATAQ
jgi:hypothetical protein